MISFPESYPGELLYSRCARYHDRMNYPTIKNTIHELFHKYELSVIHINSIATLTNNLIPNIHNSSEFIIENNSLLPFYRPYISEEINKDIIDFMMGDGRFLIRNNERKDRINVIKRRPFLRFCPICVSKDIEYFGECYWHRSHQVLGMEICLIHKVLLLDSTVSTLNYGGLISAEKAIDKKSISRHVITNYNKILFDIAIDIEWISKQKTGYILNSQLKNKIRVACINRGVAYYSGLINSQMLQKKLKKFYSN
jgi:hypothetical protein